MKKLVVLLLVFLVGCSTSTNQVICEIEYSDTQKIERSLLISHKDNTITKVEAVDKIYFDDIFTPEAFEKLETEIASKLGDAKHLEYELIKQSDHVELTAKLVNIENAYANELSFIGIEINDKEMPLGLKETLELNKQAGYTCSTEE